MRKVGLRVMFLMVAAVFAAGCQTTNFKQTPTTTNFMAAGAPINVPPPGFIAFCLSNPDQCAAREEGPKVISLDEAMWALLNTVNDDVNRSIRIESDMAHYGRGEFWTISTDGYGDCEDYALTKRKKLIEAGLPAAALRVAVVRTFDGIGHAVLTVATDRGDYVLDNIVWYIVPWNETNYTWISRQDPVNPVGWVSLRQTYAGANATAVTRTAGLSAGRRLRY